MQDWAEGESNPQYNLQLRSQLMLCLEGAVDLDGAVFCCREQGSVRGRGVGPVSSAVIPPAAGGWGHQPWRGNLSQTSSHT